MTRLFSILVICSFVFASCSPEDEELLPNTITGNGEMESTNYFMDNFYQLEIEDQFFVTLVQDSTWKIELEGESNIIPYIDIFVRNSSSQSKTLVIKFNDEVELKPTENINVVVHHRGLERVSLMGAGGVYGYNNSNHIHYDLSGSGTFDVSVFCYALDITSNGVGEIHLAGESEEAYITISGLCDIYAEDLFVKRLWTTITGKAKEYLNVSEELHVDITGQGYVYYEGDPEVVSNITGIGTVQKRE